MVFFGSGTWLAFPAYENVTKMGDDIDMTVAGSYHNGENDQ